MKTTLRTSGQTVDVVGAVGGAGWLKVLNPYGVVVVVHVTATTLAPRQVAALGTGEWRGVATRCVAA